ncbi:cobalt/nickel transport system permease protein [Aneurinibacillus soli]|uniref:Cobalt transport protein CbiQ n=1 Tax=Aneurinibacillus soli TaxID=1500254 RepID=A0A0U4NEG4_9BACL|nr:cobalt ECF transporter T component CbiQ [Aneurinibacillus soli]PYE60300.1 cobalt/nickel transport system permease protein [Aneurinibacillus soli]BAU27300.1 Cobalt transport protein CbiQ [Aneurinibacillus soli]
MQLDAYAYGNHLRMLPPAYKTGFAMGILSIAFLSHVSVQLMIFGWMSIWIVRYAGIPSRLYIRLIGLAFVFVVLSLPALLVEVTHDKYVPVTNVACGFVVADWYLYISKNGLDQAGRLAARALAAISCLYFLMLTVPFNELLHVLRRLRIPEIILELMLVMYRFIFVLLDVAANIRVAQLSRGGHNGFRNTMQDMGRLFVQVFACAMEKQRKLAIGLAARGFDGTIRVYQVRDYKMSSRYSAEAIIGILVLIGMEWLIRSGL